MKLLKNNLIFISVSLILIVSGLFLVRSSQESSSKLIFNERVVQTKNYFDKTINLVNQPLGTLSTDYTYWDDMVSFVKTADPIFAENNLEPALNTYQADGIWIYNLENKLVYSVIKSNEGLLRGRELPESAQTKTELFTKNKLIHFYIKTQVGYLEVRGATIHPENDPERHTAPQGYFFAAHYLNNAYLKNIKEITDNTIRIVPSVENPSDQLNTTQGKLTFYRPLFDSFGKTIGYYQVEREFNSVKKFVDIANRDFIILLVLSLIIAVTINIILFLESQSLIRAQKLAAEMTLGLKENEEKFRLLAENSKEVIALLKPDNTYVYVSPAIKNLTGFEPEEILGRSSYDFIHPDDVSRVRNLSHSLAVIQKTASNVEYRFKKKDGEFTWFETITQPVLFRDGKVDLIQSSSRDISDRKRSETELAQQTEELTRLNKALVNRELKMIDLKKELKKLKGLKTDISIKK